MPDTLINRDPHILSGTPMFTGTKVPVRILIDYLESGDPLDEFLKNDPTVSRKQAMGVLDRVNCGTRTISRIRCVPACRQGRILANRK